MDKYTWRWTNDKTCRRCINVSNWWGRLVCIFNLQPFCLQGSVVAEAFKTIWYTTLPNATVHSVRWRLTVISLLSFSPLKQTGRGRWPPILSSFCFLISPLSPSVYDEPQDNVCCGLLLYKLDWAECVFHKVLPMYSNSSFIAIPLWDRHCWHMRAYL